MVEYNLEQHLLLCLQCADSLFVLVYLDISHAVFVVSH